MTSLSMWNDNNDCEIESCDSSFVVFFWIQFYAPFKIISAHMRRANQ